MAEPLDADTLAAMELLWRTATRNANNVLVPRPDFAALLAVARDHARLTAENEALRETLVETQHRLFRSMAGDQKTWMGGGLEITYPSAEATDD
jgi:hypothetical protein